MKTALVALNVSYIHKNLALRWLWVTKPAHHEAQIFEGLTKQPLHLLETLLAYNPDVVALSVYIFNLEASLTLIRALKAARPELLVVAGGPEATYNPTRLFEAGIDRLYRGEAELVFWHDLDGQTVSGVMRHPDEDVDVLRVNLAHLEQFSSPYFLPMDAQDMDRRYLYVESSRGCPFGCTYCLAAQDPKVRTFSESTMMNFFDQVAQTSVRQIKFLDRTFNLDRERALRLAQRCLSLPEGMSVHVELVGDRLSDDLIDVFAHHPERFRLELGVQSLNAQTLKAVKRVSDLPKLLSVIERFAQAGLVQHTDLIAGLPHEDVASFQASYNGLIRLRPHEVQVGVLKILHGSALQDLRNAEGYLVDETPPYTVRQTPWMSEADLRQVEAVALATEKAYNSQKLREELILIFESVDPFQVMSRIGDQLLRLPTPYTNQAFYLAVYHALCEMIHPDRAKALVQHAYLRHAKTVPPKLFETVIDKRTLNGLRKHLALPDHIKHLVISDRIDGDPGYLVWCFGNQPKEPTPITLDAILPIEKDIV
jgi:anaerobic magnesium-protoporphyrin IX monomethyl ester cyclase